MIAWPAQGGEPSPGQDGWVTLFDGTTLRGWKASAGADWAVKDGTLVGTKGEILNRWHWTGFELSATCKGSGSIRCRVAVPPLLKQPGYWLAVADGTLRADGGREVAKGADAKPKDWRELRLVAEKEQLTVFLDGQKVGEGSDSACPERGMIGFAADGGTLEVKRLRVRPLGLPKIANIPAENTYCYVCHANFEKEPLAVRHLEKDVGCAKCHGPSLAHRSDEDNVTPPDILYRRGEIEPACLACHKRHAQEKAAAKSKVPGKRPLPPNPICTDCHGDHRAPN